MSNIWTLLSSPAYKLVEITQVCALKFAGSQLRPRLQLARSDPWKQTLLSCSVTNLELALELLRCRAPKP